MSLGDCADDAQLIFSVVGVIVDEFADARLRVVSGDEGEFVRIFTRTFDCAYQDFLHFHKVTHPLVGIFSCPPFSCQRDSDRKMTDRKMAERKMADRKMSRSHPIVP